MKKKKRGKKKKKIFKGFTMVELLVAIAIMGLLLIMAFPIIRAVQTNNSKKKFEEYGKAAISAAKLYADSYGEDLFEPELTNQFQTITFNDMVKKDLIKDINMTDATCVNNSTIVVVKYKDDYAYCLHLVCKSESGDAVLYEEKNRKGSCSNFKTVKVTYIYNDDGLERKTEKEIIKGEEEYRVLSPSQVGFNLEKNHEVLTNWEEVGKGRLFSPGDIIREKIQSNITLVAKTRKFIYTINYDKGIGTGTMEPTNCSYGSPCILRNNSFKKDYYSFEHWTNKNNSSSTFGNGVNVQNSLGNVTTDGLKYTLVASYKKNRTTVKYNANGGTLASQHGTAISLSSNKILVNGKEEHHVLMTGEKLGTNGLIDWNNKSYLNLTRTAYTIKSGEEWKPTSGGATVLFNQKDQYTAEQLCPSLKTGNCTVTLNANWIPATYTCAAGKYLPSNKTVCETCLSKYYCKGGTFYKKNENQGITICPAGYQNSPAGSSKESQCYMNVAANKYVKTAKASSSTACATGYTKAAHQVNYGNTSSCNPKTITVTFNCNGGTGGGSQTFTYGVSGQKFSKTCTRKGYSIEGWKLSAGAAKRDYTTNSGVSDNWINTNAPSKTLYAHWKLTHPYYNSAGNYYTLLQKAMDDTPNNGTIYLQQNYNDSGKAKLNSNKKLTFDARGYTLNLTNDNIEVAKGELTLKNGKINTSTEDNSAILCSGGKVNIVAGVTIHCSYVTNKELGTQAIKITKGTVNMTGGTVSSGEGDKSGYAKCVHLTGGSFIMSGGKIQANATKASGHGGTGINNSGGTVTLKSGAVVESIKGGTSRCGVCGNSGKSIIKSGATVKINGHVDKGKAPAVLWASSGKICYEEGVTLGCKGATRCVKDTSNITKKGKGKC